MVELFLDYEESLKLKELGFNEECLGRYIFKTPELKWSLQLVVNKNNVLGSVSAPLWQQAFDWFREKHNIHSEIRSYTADKFTFVIQKLENVVEYIEYGGIKTSYKTYEEARLKCLEKLIELTESTIKEFNLQ